MKLKKKKNDSAIIYFTRKLKYMPFSSMKNIKYIYGSNTVPGRAL